MTRAAAIELTCLYGPVVAAGLVACWKRPSKALATGLLFALLWNLALLPWVDCLARMAGCWSYHSIGPHLAGMPLALYLGWGIGWGVFAPLLADALGKRTMWLAVLLVAIDLRTMPEMEPVLHLHPHWFIGEFALAVLVLVPGLWLARWTAAHEKTEIRCALLVPTFGGVFLGIPLLLICGNLAGVLARWNSQSGISQILFLSAAMIFSVPGLTAVRDLARSGGGTPVPLDPPRRLVAHGIYAFFRNPMQFSMTCLLVLESSFLMSPWPVVLAFLGVVYSEGFARWSESQDMGKRFGEAWHHYRKCVRPWWPRWNPVIGEPCELWIDRTCGPCAEVQAWLERRSPQSLTFHNARDWPGTPLQRITWDHPPSGRIESGVCAFAMALQHLSLPYAVIGWIAGLPVISHLFQICMDAAGAGKRPSLR